MKLKESVVQTVEFEGHSFFVKRDDLLHPDFSGNKARKLYYLLNQDLSAFSKIISFGSVQSNAMYSLSALCRLRNIPFEYYVERIPGFLLESPAGNYQGALNNGARVIPVAQDKEDNCTLQRYVESAILENEPNALYVPEGGRYQDAQVGVALLADEIADWLSAQDFSQLKVMLPSGTGTTALFLQQRFNQLGLAVEVITCACVGGNDYLKQQFLQLSIQPKDHPTVIDNGRKYHFAKLYREFYHVWLALKAQTGIEFDLLYDPQGWLLLIQYLSEVTEKSPVIYIHQGGLLGNHTMLPRYRRKYPEC